MAQTFMIRGNAVRAGRFRISSEMLSLDDVRIVFASCIIIGAEFKFESDLFEYVAVSPQFDELRDGDIIPIYTWDLTMTEPLGQMTVTARRVVDGPAQNVVSLNRLSRSLH